MDKNICIFGDSVTRATFIKNSWVNLLTDFLRSKYTDDNIEVFNLGINGDTSKGILKRFNIEARSRNPQIIIFAIGINDSSFCNDEQTVSETDFEKNIMAMINQARKYTDNIYFVGLVLGNKNWLKTLLSKYSLIPSYSISKAKKYNAIIKKIALENKCTYIHLIDKLTDDDFIDGLHPNGNGHQKMFAEIKKYF